jgi:putative transposase
MVRHDEPGDARPDATAKLARHHHHVANVRRHFLHQVSNKLVKTHDRLVIENLNVSGMLANHRLAQAISDAGWAEFARLLGYKQAWRGAQSRSPTGGIPRAGYVRPAVPSRPI